MPVGEFMDRLSNSREDVEANLSTVFHSVRGSDFVTNYVKCGVDEDG